MDNVMTKGFVELSAREKEETNGGKNYIVPIDELFPEASLITKIRIKILIVKMDIAISKYFR